MSKEEIEAHIEPLQLALNGWNEDTTHPDRERIISEIKQELKFFECKLALIDNCFMLEFPLTRMQCLEYIYDFDAMKQEKVSKMPDLETIKQN